MFHGCGCCRSPAGCHPSSGEFPTSSTKLKAAGKLHQDQGFCCWTPNLFLMLDEICGPAWREGAFPCGSLRNLTRTVEPGCG